MLSRSFKEKLFFLIIIVSFFYALVDIIITGNWYMLLVIYVIASINGLMGINIGCHRYFSHGGFETKPWKEKLLAFWCILAGHSTGPIAFTGIHGHHHKYSDTEHDVHSPITRPWWYIASGLVFLDFNRDRITWSREARKLFAKPYLKWIEHNYFRIWTGIIAMAYLIGGLDLVIYGFLAPAGYWVLQGSALINCMGHRPEVPGSYTNFNNTDYSTNNKFINWITWGEGFQNNHHCHPREYNHAMWPGEFDPAAWIIKKVFAEPKLS
jgi:stearoyl-CoA desaturase (delta-9 desaturase)